VICKLFAVPIRPHWFKFNVIFSADEPGTKKEGMLQPPCSHPRIRCSHPRIHCSVTAQCPRMDPAL